MKKILSVFLLSAMLVLVLGACESEEFEDWDEAAERQRLERIESNLERLDNQVYTILCELEWRLALDGQWMHSPFKNEAEYDMWVRDRYRKYAC